MDALFLQDRRPGDASVENVGIKVRSVRPDHGTQLRIDAGPREAGGVAQRLEDSSEAEIGREIDHALDAILELKMQAIIAERFCSRANRRVKTGNFTEKKELIGKSPLRSARTLNPILTSPPFRCIL